MLVRIQSSISRGRIVWRSIRESSYQLVRPSRLLINIVARQEELNL